MRILVVEDEHKIASSIKKGLAQESYAVDVAYDGVSGFDLAATEDYAAIILDVMLPKVDGMTLLGNWRANGRKSCVLMLTAKDALQDKVAGLNLGADDYMTKPFSPRELVVRAHHLLLGRELRTEKSEEYKLKDVFIDVPGQFVSVNGQRMELTAFEIKLVSQLTNAILRRLDADWT